MNKRRLLKLADLLEADAKNKKGVKFDLGTWAKPATGCFNPTFDNRKKEVKVDCGTSACAMGLAAISGAFQREGLTYSFRENKYWGGFELQPCFERSRGFNAAVKMFEITSSQSRFLFDPSNYNKTKGAAAERFVARRIRDFVSGKVAA